MSTTETQFNAAAIGVASDPVEFEVTRERIIQYAEATNDTIAPHAEGVYAPPVFAIVPAFEILAPTMAEVIPPELLMMGVHGEQDFRFHRPIEPGMTLVTTATPVGFQARSSGVTVTVRAHTATKEGEPVVDQDMTSFVRGASSEISVGEAPADHAFDESLRAHEPDARVTQQFDGDQTFRYSEASGDPMPIHLDEDVAKAMGLPGIIIHGLCTMAFCSRAIIQTACPEDPTRLRRLAVRFSKVVQPEQQIITTIWRSAPDELRFETEAVDGGPVIKDGLAEVRG